MADTHSTPAQASPRITTVAGRKALAPRRDPYFEPIAGNQGASLGFRKLGAVNTERGTWGVRVWRDDIKKYKFQALGALADHNAATKAAHGWLDLFRKGFTDTEVTVRKVCADFADAVEKSWLDGKPPRPDTAKGMRRRFAVWVDAKPVGAVKLSELKGVQLRDWRKDLEETQDKTGKQRSPSSINRIMVDLRAALNWAHKDRELVASDAPWAIPLRKIANADNARKIYLTVEQRYKLRDTCPVELQPLVSAMILLPVRPGALTPLKVSDFQKATGVLTIPKDKAGAGRSLKLPPETAEFFAQLCKGKSKDALIFPSSEGTEWTAGAWGEPIRGAREQIFAEGTEAREATLYTFRHCSITDLVHGGVALSKVAQWAGTSIAQIDRHYAQYIPEHAEKGLAILAKGRQ